MVSDVSKVQGLLVISCCNTVSGIIIPLKDKALRLWLKFQHFLSYSLGLVTLGLCQLSISWWEHVGEGPYIPSGSQDGEKRRGGEERERERNRMCKRGRSGEWVKTSPSRALHTWPPPQGAQLPSTKLTSWRIHYFQLLITKSRTQVFYTQGPGTFQIQCVAQSLSLNVCSCNHYSITISKIYYV